MILALLLSWMTTDFENMIKIKEIMKSLESLVIYSKSIVTKIEMFLMFWKPKIWKDDTKQSSY